MIEPIFHITYDVVAYDEGGYGDNRSRVFTNGGEAVEYAKSLDQKKFCPTVIKRIAMETISVKIYPVCGG